MNNKILVLDDEREIAEVIALYLRNEGYEVELAFTGREALRKVEAESPVLALLDVMLPDMDGFAVLQKIRESYRFPVIMLTAKDPRTTHLPHHHADGQGRGDRQDHGPDPGCR